MVGSTADLHHYSQYYQRGSNRRGQDQRETETASSYQYGDSSNGGFSSSCANVDTDVVLSCGFESSYDSSFQQPSDGFPLFAGLDTPGIGSYPFPDQQATGDNAPNRVIPAEDYSKEGFYATLDAEGYNTAANGVDNEQDNGGRFVTNSGYGDFATSQNFDYRSTSFSSFGQSFSGSGSYDGFSTARPLLGMPSSSHLTVPSSAGPSSYTASEAFSDQEGNVYPQFDIFERESFSSPQDHTEIAPLNSHTGPRQRSVSCAIATSTHPSVWNPRRYSMTNARPGLGSNQPQVGHFQPADPSITGYNNFNQPPPTSAIALRPDTMLRVSSSELTSGAPPFSVSEASGTSSATRRPRSSSRTSQTHASARAAYTTGQSYPNQSFRCLPSPRSPTHDWDPASIDGDSPGRRTFLRPSLKPKRKGRRKGPLDKDKKGSANKRRMNRDTCLSCKFRKVKCPVQPSDVCKECERQGLYCVPYHFNQFRKEESLDFLAQFYCNHSSDQNTSRRWIIMDPVDSFAEVQARVQRSEHIGFLRFWFGRRLLYTVDLEQCASIVKGLESAPDALRSFNKSIDDAVYRRECSWLQFHDDTAGFDDSLHLIQRMIDCTEMIPWHTFTILDPLPLQFSNERPLDPNMGDDVPHLQTAAGFSRLISKRLEQAGYEQLHQRLNSLLKQPSHGVIEHVKTLLLSLRRRLCMWDQLPDLEGKADWSHRVRRVCEVLYFHYFNAIGKPLSSPSRLEPAYVEQTVWQDLFALPLQPSEGAPTEGLPTENSRAGFDQWLMQGYDYLCRNEAQLDRFFVEQPQASANDSWYGGSTFGANTFDVI